MDYITIWTGITTIGTAVAIYIWYRNQEIINLAKSVVEAYKDKTISEEEYKEIVDKLGSVIYKK